MATSTPRDPPASDESCTLGAGLTAERVPPAPCAAITIATRASRETPGRRPKAAITMATRAGELMGVVRTAQGWGLGGADGGETRAPDFLTSPW